MSEDHKSQGQDDAVVVRMVARRDVVRLLAAAPLAAFAITLEDVERASDRAAAALQAVASRGQAFKPKYFTPTEWQQVRILADLVIPRDERSGSATDAGVPEFMDFMMVDQPARQTAMRGGLAWIDRQCLRRYDKSFVGSTAVERAALLDDISWPQRPTPAMTHGITFFTSFRDLTASGFWTTRMGIDDLQYMGNIYVAEWKGCPDEALKKLGLTPLPE